MMVLIKINVMDLKFLIKYISNIKKNKKTKKNSEEIIFHTFFSLNMISYELYHMWKDESG